MADQGSKPLYVYTGSDWIPVGGAVAAQPGRNLFINGDFSVNQRVNPYTGSGHNPFGFAADRWLAQCFGAGPDGQGVTVTRMTFAPGQTGVAGSPRHYLRAQFTCAGTPGSNAFNRIRQTVEDVYRLSGQITTLSFWAKADTARTGYVVVDQNFGVGGSNEVGFATSIALTTAWKRFVWTFEMPSIAGKTVGTLSRSSVSIGLYKGAGWNGAQIGSWSSGTLDLADVQMEAGPAATPFDRRSQGEQLLACKRYYQKSPDYDVAPSPSGMFPGLEINTLPNAIAATQTWASVRLPVEMRVAPSVLVTGWGAGVSQAHASGIGDSPLGFATPAHMTNKGFNVFNDSGTAWGAGGWVVIFHWLADAELI